MKKLDMLFAEIIELKDMAKKQMQQHVDSYTDELAFRLRVVGIEPPPWLSSPSSNSHFSNTNVLEKEKIISKRLRDSSQYSTGDCYRPAAAAGGNERLSNVMCMENHSPNKVLNEPMATRDSNEIACLNRVPELHDNVKSPLNEHEVGDAAPDMTLKCHNNDTVCSLNHHVSLESPQNEKNSSIYAAPEMSLARIQRSK